MEKKDMVLDELETSLLALAVKMQIETLEEGIDIMTHMSRCNIVELIEMRNMLSSYKKIYKRFGNVTAVVDDYMIKTGDSKSTTQKQ